MTERKPAGLRFEDFVERQIREAQERGAFQGLPGAGQPLRGLDEDPQRWVVDKARREGLDTTAMLPPALALAKEVEDLPTRLARERTETGVRRLVVDLDDRIRTARLGPQVGPPVRVRQLDVEAVVASWRAARAAAAPPVPAAPAPPAPRRRWWRR